MSRTFAGILVGVLILGAASVSMAGIPDPDNSDCVLGPDAGMCTCPAGDGPPYEEVLVTAKDGDATPGAPRTAPERARRGGQQRRARPDSRGSASR